MRKRLAAIVFMLASSAALCADVSPGLWEITMETRVPADAGFAPQPYKITQCLSAQDAKDPGRLFAQFGNPGAKDCAYSERSYSGNTFSFAMRCSGSFAIRSNGRVSFTPDTMDGTITAFASIGDRDVETQNKVSARRVGGC